VRIAQDASEWRVAFVSLVIATLAASPVAAQGEDAVQQARAEFGEGVQCVSDEDWACAETHFRQALELHDAATIRYNLASVLVELAELPEAARLAASVLEDEEADEALRGRARELLDVIAETGGVAEVVVEGAPADAELRVDGEPVPAAQWTAVPIAAGEHSFAVYSGERPLSEQSVTAEAGGRVQVAIVVVATPEQAAEAGDQAGEGGGIDFDSLVEDPIFWAVAGGALAGVVLIIVIVAVAAGSGGTQEPMAGDFEPGVLRW